MHVDEKNTTLLANRKFLGEYFDSSTDLSYLNARYYNGKQGRFLSQDPSYLAIGDPSFESRYGRSLQSHLSNPQSLNSYSYANDNPITYSDKSGEIVDTVADIFFVGNDIARYIASEAKVVGSLFRGNLAAADNQTRQSVSEMKNMLADTGSIFVPFVSAGVMRAGNDVVKLTSSQLGKQGEKILGDIVGPGEIHKMFSTSQGKRFVDRYTGQAIHEVKNGYISATKFVQKQVSKDAEILKNNQGLQSVWHLLKGGSENVKNIIQSLGSKVIDYTKK